MKSSPRRWSVSSSPSSRPGPEELYGPVASDPTLWRALEEIGAEQRAWISAARAKIRKGVWALIEARHSAIPPSRVAEVDLGPTIVIRMDATIQIAHSDKEQATGTFKGTYGHHPLTAWCDNTGESLAFLLRPGRAGSNTASDHIRVLTEAIAQIPAPKRRNLLITVDGSRTARAVRTLVVGQVHPAGFIRLGSSGRVHTVRSATRSTWSGSVAQEQRTTSSARRSAKRSDAVPIGGGGSEQRCCGDPVGVAGEGRGRR
jgi:hypothetical protein